MTWIRNSGTGAETLSEADRFVLNEAGTVSEAAVLLGHDVRPSGPSPSASTRCTWLWFSAHEEIPRFAVENDTDELPPWVDPVLRSFTRLRTLPPNWDSYGAQVIETRTVNAALALLTLFMRHSSPTPSVVPLPSGGVQLEWHVEGVDLEIAVQGPDSAEVLVEERLRASWEGELPAALPRLRAVMDRLSR